MPESKPIADRAHEELKALRSLKETNPRLFLIVCFVGCAFLGLWFYEKFWGKAALKAKLDSQQQQIILLETQLAPFKTIALERYSGNETDALAKLALKLHDIEEGLEVLSNYQGVSHFDPFGHTMALGAGLAENSPLIDLLKDSWEVKENKIYPKVTPEALAKYEEAVQKFPDFPFGYYAMAVCLRALGDPRWRVYAEQGVRIFEKTTRIKDHPPSHDDALKELKDILRQ